MVSEVVFEDWGLIDYLESVDKQLHYVEEVAAGLRSSTIVFCTHSPVVTLGRATQATDVFAWQGPTIEVSRGGRATYHGPSQVVIYPIINLNESRSQLRPKDVASYLRNLENAIIDTLSDYGIESQGKSLQKKFNEDVGAEETGVWVGMQKIASLGVAVKKWVTYHGAALNVKKDPSAFQGMNPCGFKSNVMLSMEEKLQQTVDLTQLQEHLKINLQKYF